VAQLFADETLAGTAFEEDLAGFGVVRQQVGLVVDEVEWTAVAGGGGFACGVVGDALAEIRRVAGVEVAILGASEDVDVVHVLVSDGGWRECQLLGGP
jgi:hypothetical protein